MTKDKKERDGFEVFAWTFFLTGCWMLGYLLPSLTECHSYGEYTILLFLVVMFGIQTVASLLGLVAEELG